MKCCADSPSRARASSPATPSDQRGTDLDAVIEAYTAAIVEWMTESGRLLPEIFGVRLRPVSDERVEGLTALRQLLVEASAPHRGEIRLDDADAALAFIGRTITASAMHRALSVEAAPDGMTWQQWRARTVLMAVAYLTVSDPP